MEPTAATTTRLPSSSSSSVQQPYLARSVVDDDHFHDNEKSELMMSSHHRHRHIIQHFNNRQSFFYIISIYTMKFILEVLGSGGAIWGFSEACGLRNSSNIWLWRPIALFVCMVFSIRWFYQLYQELYNQQPQEFHIMDKDRDILPLTSTTAENQGETVDSEMTALTDQY